MAIISIKGLRLTLGKFKLAPPYFLLSFFFLPNNRTEFPLSVSSTTSTILSICCTPITLRPFTHKLIIFKEKKNKKKRFT